MTEGHSLVSVFRHGRLVRVEDFEGRTLANIIQGRLKVTSHGMANGYYVYRRGRGDMGELRKDSERQYFPAKLRPMQTGFSNGDFRRDAE